MLLHFLLLTSATVIPVTNVTISPFSNSVTIPERQCADKYLYELSLTPLPSLGGSCDFLSHPLFPLSEQFAASGFVLKSFLKGRPKNGFKMGNRRRKRRMEGESACEKAG